MEKSINRSKIIPCFAHLTIELRDRLKKRLMIPLFLISILQPLTSNISEAQTLNEYLQEAAENNPELSAYFHDYLAALQRVPQVGALPDPELSGGFFLRPMERFMGNERANFQLMQMFPWFGTLSSQKDEASEMALARYEAFRDVQNNLFYQVKTTWYEMYRLEEEIKVTKENLAILEKYERLALTRFQNAGSASGSTGMPDVLRTRMEIKELESSIALLESSRKPLQVTFNTFLNRDINDSIQVAGSLSVDALDINELALLDSITQNNPMLKMLDAEAQAYESQKRMAKLQGRPMLGVGVEYMLMRPRIEGNMSMGGHDMVMPMMSVTLPIYRKKYNAMQKEAEVKQTALQKRRKNVANQLAVEWSTAIRDLEDANRRSRLYQEQGKLARQTLDLLMTAYSTSGRDFEELLRAQQQMLDYQLQFINAVVDQHTAVARLEMLVGGDD